MISREPTIERLAVAKSLLLTPFGLDESHLRRALLTSRRTRLTKQTCISVHPQ
jgi:TldD protein